jgi:hypothetical protein
MFRYQSSTIDVEMIYYSTFIFRVMSSKLISYLRICLIFNVLVLCHLPAAFYPLIMLSASRAQSFLFLTLNYGKEFGICNLTTQSTP